MDECTQRGVTAVLIYVLVYGVPRQRLSAPVDNHTYKADGFRQVTGVLWFDLATCRLRVICLQSGETI